MILSFAFTSFCPGISAMDSKLIYEGTEKPDAIGIISGTPAILNEKDVLFSLKFDFSGAEIVNFDRDNYTVIERNGAIDEYNRKHGEDFVRNWPENLMSLNWFTCKSFSKTFKAEFLPADIIKSDARPKYDIVIRPALFDMGHFVALGSSKDGGNIIKGIMFIYEGGTNNVVASFDLNYVRGKNVGYGNNDRLRQLGKPIAKLLNDLIKQ